MARHGEATPDGELTPAGRRQASLLGERLATVPLTGVFHSPVARAARTAEIVASSVDVPLTETELLDDYPPTDALVALNAANAALTVLQFREDRVTLVTFNDQSHLPADLRWTGFPTSF